MFLEKNIPLVFCSYSDYKKEDLSQATVECDNNSNNNINNNNSSFISLKNILIGVIFLVVLYVFLENDSSTDVHIKIPANINKKNK